MSKGQSSFSTVGKIILVLLLVVGLIILYSKVMKGSTRVFNCNVEGGDCTKGTCDFLKQVPALSDKAAGCNSGEICCINLTKVQNKDLRCIKEDNTDYTKIDWIDQGKPCKDDYKNDIVGMYCSEAKTCVTLCQFCDTNAQNDKYATLCKVTRDTKTKEFFNSNTVAYSCSCDKPCTEADKNSGKCIPNYCLDAETITTKVCCY